jgi:hypothetical protein
MWWPFSGRVQRSGIGHLRSDELRALVLKHPNPENRQRRGAEQELRRRETWWTGTRGWIAIGVSVVALIVSLVALLMSCS